MSRFVEIHSLTTEAFRNLAPSRVELHPRLNLIVGENGQGKTNVLEAIALVSGRPSFRTSDPAEVRADSVPRAVVSVRVLQDERTEVSLGVAIEAGARTHSRDGKRITRLEAGRLLPAVFLTAADLGRFSGPPAERRRPLDRVAHALDPEHGRTLARYERSRAAKTRLLAAKGRYDADELAVYEEALAVAGGRIAAARHGALRLLGEELSRQAAGLRSPFSGLSLSLVSDLPAGGSREELSAALRRAMAARKVEERRAGRCLAGPHRDDVVLAAGGIPVVERASSGESRTLVLAWTLAELAVVGGTLGATPLLAFDDFDSEWDPGVLAAFAEALPDEGQVFLTSARPEAVRGLPLPPGGLYRMQAGRLSREGILGAGRTEVRERAAGR